MVATVCKCGTSATLCLLDVRNLPVARVLPDADGAPQCPRLTSLGDRPPSRISRTVLFLCVFVSDAVSWSFITILGSRPGYVKDLVWKPQTTPDGESDASMTHSVPAEPISIPAPSIQAPDGGEELSSVRNTSVFSPADEREQRWLAFEQSLAASPSVNTSKLETESNARAPSGSKVSYSDPIPLNEVLIQGPEPAEPPGRPEASASSIPQPQTPAVDTRMPEPSRRPPDMSVYAPSLLQCQHCQRTRPPRAHHCRRCGTCVLRMDHHCPWIGGCVGAENYQYYYNTVFWGLLLSTYVIVSMAVLFARGIKSQKGLPWSERIRGWNVDGYMISVFVISFFFFLFTGSLFIMHTYLSGHNLTSIEQRAINSFRAREGLLLQRYYSRAGQGGTLGSGPIGMWRRFKARRRLLHAWNVRWGYPHKEGNPWWLGSLQEWEYAASSPEAIARETELEKTHGLFYASLPHTRRQVSKSTSDDAPLLETKPSIRRPPYLLNMEQSLGPVWGWFLPIPHRTRRGLHFPLNPRFSQDGFWMPKEMWPAVVQGTPETT